MTPRQISKKLAKAGFDMAAIVEVGRDEVTIGYVVDGVVPRELTEKTEAAVDLALGILGWGGTCSQWGGWRLRAGYVASEHDVNSVYHPMHY